LAVQVYVIPGKRAEFFGARTGQQGDHDVCVQGAVLAPLRCGIDGRVELVLGRRSDRLGEFGERGGDPQGRWGVDGKFVVAAAKVLHEGVSGDDHLCCLVRS
jgi:hypothetical protein